MGLHRPRVPTHHSWPTSASASPTRQTSQQLWPGDSGCWIPRARSGLLETQSAPFPRVVEPMPLPTLPRHQVSLGTSGSHSLGRLSLPLRAVGAGGARDPQASLGMRVRLGWGNQEEGPGTLNRGRGRSKVCLALVQWWMWAAPGQRAGTTGFHVSLFCQRSLSLPLSPPPPLHPTGMLRG